MEVERFAVTASLDDDVARDDDEVSAQCWASNCRESGSMLVLGAGSVGCIHDARASRIEVEVVLYAILAFPVHLVALDLDAGTVAGETGIDLRLQAHVDAHVGEGLLARAHMVLRKMLMLLPTVNDLPLMMLPTQFARVMGAECSKA